MIRSDQGYPRDDELLTRVDYYITVSPCEGGILIVGKDSRGTEYKPKTEPAVRSFYVLPSGSQYSVPVGSDPEKNHLAIYFPFQLDTRRWNPKISNEALEAQDFDDKFFDKFDLTLMDESKQRISLDTEVEGIFKKIAVWGAYELKGLVRNHFWGEMYLERTPALEKFLEAHRG